ncbi:MAG: alcohol dehydrogenase catalytic domain-containing protein [Planctomycetes bacterium]|nr:alcohol dehydrogenase catalytic domain-containing protein [Planctomycetota bacterium]
MKAAVVTAPGRMEILRIDDPVPGPGEVLVRTRFVSPCGSEHHAYLGEFGPRIVFPAVFGHEMSGVVELAPRDSGFLPGDRVVLDPIVPCGCCPACLDGRINACRSLRLVGIDLPGGFAEKVSVPPHQLLRIPDSVPLDDATLAEVHGIGVHALRIGRVEPGDRIVLIGTGKLGLNILDVLRESASGSIVAVDVDPFRLQKALSLGASAAVDASAPGAADRILQLTDGDGADLVIEAVGAFSETPNPPPVALALAVVRQAGRILLLGQGGHSAGIHWRTLVWKEAVILTSRTSRGVFPRVLRMMQQGLLRPRAAVTHRISLEEIPSVFRLMDEGSPGLIKALVEM